MCRINFNKNIFNREVLQTGKIFACPPLGGEDSSRELLVPNISFHGDVLERRLPYSSYDNQNIALHLRGDYASGSIDSVEQDYFVTNATTGYLGTTTVTRWINPYGDRLTGSVDAGGPETATVTAYAPTLLTAFPGNISPQGLLFIGYNAGHTSPDSYMIKDNFATLASTSTTGTSADHYTILVAFNGLLPAATSEPQQILGTPYYDVAPYAKHGAEKQSFCIRMGRVGTTGGGAVNEMADNATNLQTATAISGTVGPPDNNDFPCVSVTLKGTARSGGGATTAPDIELYHMLSEGSTQLESTNIVALRGSSASGGDLRFNGSLANATDFGGMSSYGGGSHPISGSLGEAGQSSDGSIILGFSGSFGAGTTLYDAGHLYGTIHEVIYIKEYLSDDNLKRVEGYLAHKWGIDSSLPSTHPYKLEASMYEFYSDTEDDVFAKIEEYKQDPHRNRLLSDRSSANYTSEQVCIKHNTKDVSIITGGAYAAPVVSAPLAAFHPNTGVSSKDLLLWIDPSDSTTLDQTVPGVGNTVTSIKDKALDPGISLTTDAGFHQGVAGQQPTRQTVSGLDMLSFDGSNDKMELMDNNFADNVALSDLNDGDFDIYIVFRPLQASSRFDSNAPAFSNTSLFGEAAGWFGVNIYGSDTVTPSIQAYVYDTGIKQLPATPGASISNGTTHQIQFSREGTTLKVSTDGGAQQTLTANAPATLSGALSLANAYSAFYYDGYIGEILFYNGELSSGDRTSVINYLQGKWSTP